MTLLAQAEGPPWLIIIVAVLGTGGLATAVAAFLKARPEASKILIEAAEDVVIIQKGAIDSLKAEIAELRGRIMELEPVRSRVTELERALNAEERNNAELREENTRLRTRIEALERINGR